MPENGEQFFRYLRRETNLIGENQKSNALSHIFYTILGLGSTDYSKYQFIPRFID
jgi:sulfite reductase alpha subunit-like flavoprotein